jgi:Flp pilus assembly protein TadD
MRVRELQDAAASYRKAMSLDGRLSAAHNGLGAALSLLGDHDGARIQLARAAELDQHDPNPLLNLARMNEKLGDRRGADLAWRAALDRDPNAPVPIAVRRSAGT